MTGRAHPAWCDIDDQCTAEPAEGVPFSEGEHRSRAIPLDVSEVTWAMRPSTVCAFLTRRPVDAWETRTHLHIESSLYGPLLEMPVSQLAALLGQLGRLVGPAELAQLADAAPARPVARVQFAADPVSWAATPRWRS